MLYDLFKPTNKLVFVYIPIFFIILNTRIN